VVHIDLNTSVSYRNVLEIGSHDIADPLAMKQREIDRCSVILKKLRELPVSVPFLRPVSEEEFPGYRALISNPMDLSTIRKQLKHGKYKSLIDFDRDIERIASNAQKANGHAHLVTACGRQMCAHYRKLKKQYFGSTSIEQFTEEYCTLCLKMDAILSEHPAIRHLESFSALGEVPPPRSNAELLEALSRMTSREKQMELLFLIRELEPGSQFEATNDITVNLSELKPETIAKLNDFVSE
jgi:hypothetical protein